MAASVLAAALAALIDGIGFVTTPPAVKRDVIWSMAATTTALLDVKG